MTQATRTAKQETESKTRPRAVSMNRRDAAKYRSYRNNIVASAPYKHVRSYMLAKRIARIASLYETSRVSFEKYDRIIKALWLESARDGVESETRRIVIKG